MNWALDWTHPAFWPLAGLVAVPILLHLFARARPPVYPFSSTEFIRRLLRTTQRMRRPKDWLLLALRCLLYAALIALFLGPLLALDRDWLSGRERRRVVLIVDASASMAYMEGAQTRFARACAEASAILGDLAPGDAADIVWLRAHATAVFPRLGVNIRPLQMALRDAGVTQEAADIEGAWRLAADLLREQTGRREICILSDFQTSAWDGRALVPPAGVRVAGVRIGRGAADNVALTRLSCSPAAPLVGEEVEMVGEVCNYTAQPRKLSVQLSAGEMRQRQEVPLAAWQSGTVLLRLPFSAAGRAPVGLQIEEDALMGDNRRWIAVPVQAALRVGLLEGGAGAAETWRRALEAVGWAKVETLTAAALAADAAYDAVLLDGWDGADPAALAAFVKRGGTAIWYPRPNTPRARVAAVIAALRGETAAAVTDGVIPWEAGGAPHTLRIAAADDPVFQVFAKGAYGDPARGRFTARLRLASAELPGLTPVLVYDDGVSALSKWRAGGTFWLWNLALAREHGDWARQPEYVPFLAELLLTSRTPTRATLASVETWPGEPLSLTVNHEARAEDMRLEREDRQSLPLRRRAVESGWEYVSDPVTEPGCYAWRLRDTSLDYGIVNFPAQESDLRTLDDAAVRRLGLAVAAAGGDLKALREGIPLWPWLLALAAVVFMLEALVLWWAERDVRVRAAGEA